MKQYFFLGVLAFLSCATPQNKEKAKTVVSANKEIIVSFRVDDTIIPIKDQCHITFVSNNKSIEATVKGNELFPPDMDEDTGYTIIFKCAQYSLSFDHIKKTEIFADQKMEWKFGIDNRPFDNKLGLLSTTEINSDTETKQLQYLIFDPFEHGEAIALTNKIQ